MTTKRVVKKRRKEEKDRRRRNERSRMFDRTSRVLGIDRLLGQLPDRLIELLVGRIDPRPIVTIGDDVEGDAEASNIRAELVEMMEEAVRLDEVGIPEEISPSSFLRVWFSLEESLTALLEGVRMASRKIKGSRSDISKDMAIIEEVLERLGPRSETVPPILGILFHKIDWLVNKRLSLCERAYLYDLEMAFTESGRLQVYFKIGKHLPRPLRIPTPTGQQRAYQCGRVFGLGFQLVEWERSEVGLDGPDRFPVYILRHAVDRFEERVPYPGGRHLLHNLMVEALETPRIARTIGDTLFIEFRLGDLRFGYFVAERIADAIVVRTFKFLTMQGTPEGD